MNYGIIFGSCVTIAMVLSMVILSINNRLHKQRIKNTIIPGTKYTYYGVNGVGDPFKDANVYISIINVKVCHSPVFASGSPSDANFVPFAPVFDQPLWVVTLSVYTLNRAG